MPTMTLAQAGLWGSRELAFNSDTAHLDAAVLLSEVLQCSRAYLIAESGSFLKPEQELLYRQHITRRKQGEPLAYIVGHKEFWSLDLQVTPDTLIPRSETELLVELLLQLFPAKNQRQRVADLGTGSGAVALALAQERPSWEIFATDQSIAALRVATQNAANLGINNIQFCQGVWCQALPVLLFDALLSNPPYLTEQEWRVRPPELSFEPRSALVSGLDGLRDLQIIIASAKQYLSPEGYLLLEHGATQAGQVQAILMQAGYVEIVSYHDLAGMDRVTVGRCLK